MFFFAEKVYGGMAIWSCAWHACFVFFMERKWGKTNDFFGNRKKKIWHKLLSFSQYLIIFHFENQFFKEQLMVVAVNIPIDQEAVSFTLYFSL